ncbi:hypothetical protein MKW94_030720 [Papaver nudicaule]|uniref:Agglutinin domain-containing protein n=1 Tax=Papaver nudicaule TaxID=74823 RepID=A0AA41S1Q2_PAPNU|nr:hypothetical protein [Papaver nudicaule]
MRHVKGGDADHPDLGCTGEEVLSPYTKFESVMPEMDNNDRGLVHIRCCYNNKYWVRDNEDGDRITPRATMPEEDDAKWSCTLFEPNFYQQQGTFRVEFKHVQLDQSLYVSTKYGSCIRVKPKDSGWPTSSFTFVDWQSLLVLPKHVAFKRAQYLSLHPDEGDDLVFASDDARDPAVGQEVVTTRDGSILLKSDCSNKYWHQDDDSRIRVHKDDSTKSLFQPIKVGDDIIALRSLSNGKFCRSYKDGEKYYLKADMPTMCNTTEIRVEELKDGRIYDETMITMASGEVVNRTNTADTIDLKLSYADTRTSSWNFSSSLMLGVKYTMEAGIPFICDGKIELSGKITLGAQYTTTTTTTRLAETVYRVNVPAQTSVKVSLKAATGKCDVPYSYTQRDTLFNGETETYRKDDGVFTGTNCYHLSYETEEKALT